MSAHSFTWTDPKTGFEIYIDHENGDVARISVPKELVKIATFNDHPQYSTVIELPRAALAEFGRNAALRDVVDAVMGLCIRE